jgi:FtsP/CotA-like multicopper oxidase with cupredoxin domain
MTKKLSISFVLLLSLMIMGTGSEAALRVQCPGDTNEDAQWTGTEVQPANTVCMHIVGSDGFAAMADGYPQYIFSFSNMTGVPLDQVSDTAELNAQSPAPQIRVREGQNFYLTLSTVPMAIRPDLFDGEPMATVGIFPGASFSFYYKVPAPGTYAYHCHVEATEHMQMGMLGSLSVAPLQDGQSHGGFTQFAYNDGDGTTGYDVEYPILITGFDPDFHDANLNVQPLPFAAMDDRYMMLNGRGYPDTINPAVLTPPTRPDGTIGKVSQTVNALITATSGQRVLLRIANLSSVHFSTITIPGITMRVVGKDAKILRGQGGTPLYYNTNTLTLGGGQTAEVLIGPVAAGTYFLHTTKLPELSNRDEDFGGLMTEIFIQ